MDSLEKQIADLKSEQALKKLVTAKLPGAETYSRITYDGTPRIWFTAKEKTQLIMALKEFPPTDLLTPDIYEGKSINSPFRIDIENPAMYERLAKVSWKSGLYDITVKFSENWIFDFCTRGERNIYDSEYHYFTGRDMRWLKMARLTKLNFKASQQEWYGGAVTLMDGEEATKIINQLTT